MEAQPGPRPPFWLTRDRFDGELSPDVDVWVNRPIAQMYPDGDVLWLAPSGVIDRKATHHAALPAGQVRRRLGCPAPDNERQCLRVGGDRG